MNAGNDNVGHPDWPASRAAARERLDAFVPHAGRRYAAQRNFDIGPTRRDNVSGLSPYLRHRLLREDEVVAAVLAQHSRSAAEKFTQEVLWRSYWKGWLEQRPELWPAYLDELDAALAALPEDDGFNAGYQQALNGATGIDCFDAWVAELIETGYLHNHARMWFASIWIFTLALPWQLGADFFLRHLLDGDPASNTLSWRWVAGLQTRGKHYVARADNIARYTEGRFRPDGQLHPDPAPVDDAGDAPPAGPLPPADDNSPPAPYVLLLSEEDLHAESLPPGASGPAAVLGFDAAAQRSPLEVSAAVRGFTGAAVADGLARAAAHHGVAATHLRDADQLEAALIRLLDETGAGTVVTPYAPVGPAADRLRPLEQALAARGVTLMRLRRRWDTQIWPHARRGFFALKKKIPALLDDLLPGR